MGEQARAGRGLADHRHTREERDRGLLREAPGGEVERVDVDGDAVAWHRDVLPVEAGRAAEGDPVAVHEARPSPRAWPELRVGGEGEGRPVHVEFRVAPRVASGATDKSRKLVAMGLQGAAHRQEERAALGEGQRAKRRPPLVRACSGPRRSMPPSAARASGSSVAGFTSVVNPPDPSTKRPPTKEGRLQAHFPIPTWVRTKE